MSGLGVKVALGASLVVNLFVIGAVAGAIYMRAHTPPPAPAGNPLMHDADLLTPADRDAFRQMIRAQVPTIRPIQQDSRQARREAMAQLAGPSFDRAATGALFDRTRDDDLKARGQIENAILDFAAKLPVTERQALAQGMRRAAVQRMLMRRQANGAAGSAAGQ